MTQNETTNDCVSINFFMRSGTFALFAMIGRVKKPMAQNLAFT